jgi:RNA polymerase sigma-70 factor, ECF subfamily
MNRVFRHPHGPLRRVARAITGDRETARDVVQDAFAAAIRERRRYRRSRSPEAWIWRIVVNRAISERRRLTRVAAVPFADVEPDRSANGGGAESTGPLGFAVRLLPERQRLAIFLHYYADLEYVAIAEILDISSGTVGATLHSARQALLKTLAEEEARR